MNREQANWYFLGYFQKNAGVTDAVSGAASGVANKIWLTAIMAPALAGLAAGSLTSKLTSPVGQKDVVQKALVAAELEEHLAELKRRRELEILKGKLKDARDRERSLHI